jgi:hypothetical protein
MSRCPIVGITHLPDAQAKRKVPELVEVQVGALCFRLILWLSAVSAALNPQGTCPLYCPYLTPIVRAPPTVPEVQ